MQDEIFGPVLPIKSYWEIDEAIDYINAHPRPLGLCFLSAHLPVADVGRHTTPRPAGQRLSCRRHRWAQARCLWYSNSRAATCTMDPALRRMA